MPRKGKEHAAPPADEQRDASDTAVTSQEGRWRAGVSRQSQADAQAHQVAASRAAAAKRKATAMSDAERKAKEAKHKADLRALQVADADAEKERKEREARQRREKRAAQHAAQEAATKAVHKVSLRQLNVRLREEDEESINEFEFDEFCAWVDDDDDARNFDAECSMDFFVAWREERKYAPPPQAPPSQDILSLPPLRAQQRAAPPPPPPPDDEPWGTASADMFYDGPNDHDIAEQRERQEQLRREQPGFARLSLAVHSQGISARLKVVKEDYNDGYELQCERWHNEDGRRSVYYGQAAGDLPSGVVAPLGWVPSSISRDKAAEPPQPRREDEAVYGPLANNPRGDKLFREDRAAWYESIMHQPLTGTLAEQNDKADALARSFRVDRTRSGRPGPSSAC